MLPHWLNPEPSHVIIAVVITVIGWLFMRPGRPSRRYRWNRASTRAKFKKHARLRKEARAVLRRARTGEFSADSFTQMDPFLFEYVITEFFAHAGYEIRKIKRLTGDGGIDGMVKIEGRWHILQAKRYRSPLTPSVVNSIIDTCKARRMPGIVVCCSGFSSKAKLVAGGGRLKMLDGEELIGLVRGQVTAR